MTRGSQTSIAHFTFAIDSQLAGVSEAVCLLNETLGNANITNTVFSFGNSRKTRARSLNLHKRYLQAGSKMSIDWSPFSNQYGVGIPFRSFKIFSKTSYDIVILHQIFTLSTVFGYFFCRLHKIPYLIMPHGVFSRQIRTRNKVIKFFAMKIILSNIMERAVCFVATSEGESFDIDMVTGRKSVILMLGSLTSERVLEASKDENLQIVLYAGRFSAEKNLESLIEAWVESSKKHPELTLKLVGYRNQKELNLVKDLLLKNNLLQDVLVAPWLSSEELSAEFLKSKLFVLPSLTENFGLVAAQALAHGVPCVVSPGVPLSKLIQKYSAGKVAIGFSAQDIEKAIEDFLLEDFQLLSKNALALTLGEFSSIRVVEEWLALFRAIQNNNGSGD
jgi:glycosyltransferase involved in cell wall biosynthesis